MATFVIDFSKEPLALLPIMFHLQGVSPLIFGLLAVIGHTFPIFAGFKGEARLSQPVLEWFSDLHLSSVSTLQLFSLEPSILVV